jgi:hypothetical protein
MAMQTTLSELTPETVRAILESPATAAAIAARDEAQARERAGLLEQLNSAELAASLRAAEYTKAAEKAAAAYEPLQEKAAAARLVLQHIQQDAFAESLAADGGINVLRSRLRPLGGAALDELRWHLELQKRIAAGLLDWRVTNGRQGVPTTTTPAPANAAAEARIAAIDGYLSELDALERDPAATPAGITARCTAIRAALDADEPARPAGAEYLIRGVQ